MTSDENKDVILKLFDTVNQKVADRFSVSMTGAFSEEPVIVQLLALTRFVDGRCAEEWRLSAQG